MGSKPCHVVNCSIAQAHDVPTNALSISGVLLIDLQVNLRLKIVLRCRFATGCETEASLLFF